MRLVRRELVWYRLAVGCAAVVFAFTVWPRLGTMIVEVTGLNLDTNRAWFAVAGNVVVYYCGLVGCIAVGSYVALHVIPGTWMTRRVRPTPCPGCMYTLEGSGVVTCPECGERTVLHAEKHTESVA